MILCSGSMYTTQALRAKGISGEVLSRARRSGMVKAYPFGGRAGAQEWYSGRELIRYIETQTKKGAPAPTS